MWMKSQNDNVLQPFSWHVQYFQMVLFLLPYLVVLTFWTYSMGEILHCDHSNESYWALISSGTVYYVAQGGSNFWHCRWNPQLAIEMKATESFCHVAFLALSFLNWDHQDQPVDPLCPVVLPYCVLGLSYCALLLSKWVSECNNRIRALNEPYQFRFRCDVPRSLKLPRRWSFL